ncbi:MAG: malonate decarboxylase holo-[acyl-carrier-protein] synthase [Pseudomonadota bacterium]
MSLHRHQLAYVSSLGWDRILAKSWNLESRECLFHWQRHRLPLVVTRQPQNGTARFVSLGLPAPEIWGRRKLTVQLACRDVLYFDEFPHASSMRDLLPRNSRAQWRELCADIEACGATARIYGSYGWQKITGLDYRRVGSDIDLWIAVADDAVADAVSRVIGCSLVSGIRLDGEFMFDNGAAVSWKEWQHWRSGAVRAILVKYLAGPEIANGAFWQRSRVQELTAA